MEVIYHGRYDEGVEVPLPNGRVVVAEKNKHTEIPDEVAKSLLEQEDNWKRAPKKKTTKKGNS